MPIGEVLSDPVTHTFLQELVAKAVSVAQACESTYPADTLDMVLKKLQAVVSDVVIIRQGATLPSSGSGKSWPFTSMGWPAGPLKEPEFHRYDQLWMGSEVAVK